MALLKDSEYQYADDNGNPLAAGTVTFYDTGTTTLKTIYSDAALTTSITNPTTLDAAGRHATNVYATDSERYTILVQDSAGTTIDSSDARWGIPEGGTDASYTPDGGTARTIQSKLDESPKSLGDFAPTGDGVADDTTAVHAWLNYLNTNGVKGIAPAGTYLTDNYTITTMSNNIEIECDKNAVFKYNTASSEPLFSWEHTTREVYGVKWTGGQIDNSGGISVASGQSNTCVELVRTVNNVFRDVHFKGEATYTLANAVTTGTDSGITTADCLNTLVDNCIIEGQGDAGIYFSGGSLTASTDDGGENRVVNCKFINCWQAITSKRDASRHIFANNQVKNCRTGFIGVEADSVDPGREFIIHDNFFKRIETRAIEVRANPNDQIHDNVVEDWGVQADDTTISGTPYAYILEGVSGCNFHHNKAYRVDWVGVPASNAGIHGLFVDSETINSVAYTPASNIVRNNFFNHCEFGITESTTGTNQYEQNDFGSAVTTYYNSMDSTAKIVHNFNGVRTLSSLTNVGNVGTGTDDLMTVSIPAHYFIANVRRGIKITAWGSTANNANAKTLTLNFGTTTLDSQTLTTSQDNRWRFEAVVIGNATQQAETLFTQTNSGGGATLIHEVQLNSSITETITAAITVKCTGTATTDNDIVQNGMLVEALD